MTFPADTAAERDGTAQWVEFGTVHSRAGIEVKCHFRTIDERPPPNDELRDGIDVVTHAADYREIATRSLEG